MMPSGLYYATPYYAFMILVMCLVLGLSIFWLLIYLLNRKEIRNRPESFSFFPSVSVIVPAYNEEKNIANALAKILDSDYPKEKMEVLVIDDGSTDSTASIAKEFPVRLIQYGMNTGKIYALNRGVGEAKNEIIITMDADTESQRDFIKRIVQPFADKGVGVVAGVYKAKPVQKWTSPVKYLLEKFQAVEYIGFSLLRKQQEVLESVLVAPGAVAAYSRSALAKVGKFEDDTVIEDYDMTVRMHKAGFKVRCVKDAMSYVVAPQTLKSLVRERTRWYRGGIQILKKHHDMIFTKIGLVTFVWAMETLGMFLQLIVFGLAVWMMASQMMINSASGFMGSLESWFANIVEFRIGLFDVVLLVSIIIALIGILNMKISISLTSDKKRKMLLYPLMLVYSSFLFFVFLKSVVQELIGSKNKWVKAEI